MRIIINENKADLPDVKAINVAANSGKLVEIVEPISKARLGFRASRPDKLKSGAYTVVETVSQPRRRRDHGPLDWF